MFDDISFRPEKLHWTGLTPQEIKDVVQNEYNPLGNRNDIERATPGLRELYLMSQCPEYINFAGKFLLNKEFTPMQCCMLYCLWTHAFPLLIASRGCSKSWTIAVYALIRAALMPGTKIICVGASFRQSKIIYSYVQDIFDNAPVLQSIFRAESDGARNHQDMIIFTLGKSKIIFCPIGNGEKIRGLRGNIIIADEMNSLNTEVYEVVINNFAAVAMDPVNNMKRVAERKFILENGLEMPEELMEEGFKNQSIIAGTMGFEFEPMFQYWNKYKKIIDSKGESLSSEFDSSVDLDYKDFCIMRLPYELIPKGFMDDKTIARARATIHIGAYNSEYGCVSVKDTAGFFKRSVIESCVANDKAVNETGWPDWCPYSFDAILAGEPGKKYVMGIDPASENDNLAITILEVYPEHQRIVYSWTTNRKKVQAKDPTASYWSYIARHVRNLMNRFNIVAIGIDAQGGGRSLSEALHDKDLLQSGEVPLWPALDDKKNQDTDRLAGNHIIHMFQFASAQWTSEANHGLLKDLEGKTILFPKYDPIVLGLANEETEIGEELVDCILNIEELKTELSTIVMTRTANRERWDTPQEKTGKHSVSSMRKDRYSALIIANYLARKFNKTIDTSLSYRSMFSRVGGPAKVIESSESGYYGNYRLTSKMKGFNVKKINY